MFPRWKAALAAVIAAILAWSGALALVGWYQPAQQADLGRFTRTVQTFEHDNQNVTLCRFQTIVSQRSIRTARATPSASASASPSVL